MTNVKTCTNTVILLILLKNPKDAAETWAMRGAAPGCHSGAILAVAEPQRMLWESGKTAKAKEVSSPLGPKHLRAVS